MWDTAFNMFPMGSSAGGADARAGGDQYKQGLVPEGSATHNNTYLRKDGTWGTPIDTNTDTFVNPSNVIELDGIADGSKITDDDADNFFEFGRGKIGYNGADSDDFCIAHRDYFTNVLYALKQDADGQVNINAPTNSAITFKINDALKEVVDATNHNFLTNVLVGSSNNIQLQKTSGTNITSTDNDTIYEFGRGKLGYNGADADTFCVAHRDNMSNVNYALAQGADGTTLINAKTGTAVGFRVNDVSIAFVSATALVSNFNILSNITSGEVLTSNDANLTATIGRAKIGYVGHTDWAGFGHRDNFTTTSYALLQGSNGDTLVNAKLGQTIHLRINNVSSASITTDDFTFISNAIVDSSHKLGLLKTSGSVITTSDNDTIYELGRGKLGYATNADEFVIAHRDNFTSANCALSQDEVGATILNAKSGQLLKIGINDTPVIEISATEVVIKEKIELPNTEVANGDIITDVNVNNTQSISVGCSKIGFLNGSTSWCNLTHRSYGGYNFVASSSGQSTYVNSTAFMYISINGSNKLTFTATAINSATNIIGPSDRRFKANVIDPDSVKVWNDFKKIEIKEYNKMYPSINKDKKRLGVIAQDLESIDNTYCKNAVDEFILGKSAMADDIEMDIYNTGEKFIDENGDEHSKGFKAVEYDQLYRMSMVVVKQLQERVERLEQIIINNNLS